MAHDRGATQHRKNEHAFMCVLCVVLCAISRLAHVVTVCLFRVSCVISLTYPLHFR